MNPEFVNVYIAKQKNLISELQSKLLIVEAQYEVTQSALDKTVKENETLQEEIVKLQNKKQKSTNLTSE